MSENIEEILEQVKSGPLSYPDAKALAAAYREQQRELDEFKRIRNLLVKALARATGADDASVREDPLTIAVRHARRIEELEAEVERIRGFFRLDEPKGDGFLVSETARELLRQHDRAERAESRLQAALEAVDRQRHLLLRIVSGWDVWKRVSPEGIVDAKDNLFAAVDDARRLLAAQEATQEEGDK